MVGAAEAEDAEEADADEELVAISVILYYLHTLDSDIGHFVITQSHRSTLAGALTWKKYVSVGTPIINLTR